MGPNPELGPAVGSCLDILGHGFGHLAPNALPRGVLERCSSLVAPALAFAAAAAVVVAAAAEHSGMPRNTDLDPVYRARHHQSSRWVRRTPVLYSRVKPRTSKFYKGEKKRVSLPSCSI